MAIIKYFQENVYLIRIYQNLLEKKQEKVVRGAKFF